MSHPLRRKQRSTPSAILFPANPFVALADFLFLVTLVLLLTLIARIIFDSKVEERLAVDKLQNQLRTLSGLKLDKDKVVADPNAVNDSPELAQAAEDGSFQETYHDGDLQRFRFTKLFTDKNPDQIPQEKENPNRKALIAFGKLLAKAQEPQGERRDGYRGFKRVSIEGNADESENAGAGHDTWALSLKRARNALEVLKSESGLKTFAPHTKNGDEGGEVEITGRGQFQPAAKQDERDYQNTNKRLEIVVIYSGKTARLYVANKPDGKSRQDGKSK